MDATPDIQELSIAIFAPNHNPTLLTPDFLAGSGIISTDWELSRPPVLNTRARQVTFTNGVNITAQPSTVTFSESTNNKTSDNLHIAEIAQKYTAILSNLDYQGVGINPKRFVTYDNQPDAARDYILKTLLAPGSWLQVGDIPVQASINFAYPLKNRQLRLTIGEAQLKQSDTDKAPISAILFAGNFQYNLTGETKEEKPNSLNQAIDNWQQDFKFYQNLIDKKFMPAAVHPPQVQMPEAE